MTEDGTACRLLSKYRPPCPVVVLSPNQRVLREAALRYACYPLWLKDGFGDDSREDVRKGEGGDGWRREVEVG